MDKKFSIVVGDFGGRYDYVTGALLNSIKAIYSDIEVLVIGKDIPSDDIDLINDMRENCAWARKSPGSLRNILWNQGLKMAKTEWVLFLDADMLLLKKIDNYIKMCEELKIDFVFTTRSALPYWLNMGFLFIKKKPATLSFFDKLVNEQIKCVKANIGAGQYVFQKMLERSPEQIDEISLCNDSSKIFKFTQSDINFAGISCKKLNNIYSKTPITDEVAVVHLKGMVGTILIRDNTENRFDRFFKAYIYNYPREEIFYMNERLALWKTYSDHENSHLAIDIYKHYLRNHKFKKVLSIFYISIWKIESFLKKVIKKFFSR